MNWRASFPIPALAIGAALAAVAGWLLGQLAGHLAVYSEPDTGIPVHGSSWHYPNQVGAAEASWLDRARLANSGPLGLDASEAIYFIAHQDKSGRPIQGGCRYSVRGEDFDARWWSLTLYDAATFDFVEEHRNKASYTSLELLNGTEPPWSIIIAPNEREEPWIPSSADRRQRLELVLRIYNPGEALRKRLPNIELPVIERQSC